MTDETTVRATTVEHAVEFLLHPKVVSTIRIAISITTTITITITIIFDIVVLGQECIFDSENIIS